MFVHVLVWESVEWRGVGAAGTAMLPQRCCGDHATARRLYSGRNQNGTQKCAGKISRLLLLLSTIYIRHSGVSYAPKV